VYHLSSFNTWLLSPFSPLDVPSTSSVESDDFSSPSISSKPSPLLGGEGGDSPVRGNVAKRQKGCALPKGRSAGGLSDTRKLVFVSGTYAWERSES
jgi:hypothetical protein